MNVKHALMRAHGSDPISYSTLQSGLSYFETSFGYVAFQRAFGFELTLGPPVCAEGDRAEMIHRFLRGSRRPLFSYVSRDVAQLVEGLGGSRFRVAGMGIDKVLPLGTGPDEVPLHPRIRGALKKASRGGFDVLEVRPSTLGAEARGQFESITRDYLSRSSVSVEMRFLNRPLALEDDELARLFVLRQGRDARMFGYAMLDPYFENGRIQGYLLNLIRFERTRLWGVYYAAVMALAERLRAEGVAQLSLGYCPLVEVDIEGCSPVLASQMRWMERQSSGIDYLARLREMKDAFPGLKPQRYFVTPSPLAVTPLLALLSACRVPVSWLLRHGWSARPA